MKGLYICGYDLSDMSQGVNKKIIAQIDALKKRGIEVEILDKQSVDYKETGYLIDYIHAIKGNSSILMQKLLNKAYNIIENDKINFIYIRKQLLDLKQISILQKIKKIDINIKIIMEIPTYPYDQEIKITRFIHLKNDKKMRQFINGIVDRIVTFSNDDKIFDVKTIKIMNGVSYANILPRKYKEHKSINCIAVAIFADWHGYDRFIKGMIRDKELVRECNIHLLLVGKGRILSTYKKMVNDAKMDDYVEFCGELSGERLSNMYNISDIALDSMGRHRVGVYFNSTLKGKEYCAYGLPIVSGVETELDSMTDVDFYLRIPANDTPVNMREIVELYDRMYRNTDFDKRSLMIRNHTKMYFDIEFTFKPVIDYIMDIKD